MAQVTNRPDRTPQPQPQPAAPVAIEHDIIDDTQDWVQRNVKLLLTIVGVAVVVVAAVVGFKAWQSSQNNEAEAEMFSAIYQFESDSLKKALNGDGQHPGFIEIADSYGSTKSGKLAHFYIGSIYLKQGKFDQAIEELDDFSSDDILVQARAYALLGDAYSEKAQYADAATAYTKAANHKPNRFFTPSYLMKLAIVQEAQKDYKGAKETYDRIVKDYYESQEATDARKFRARAEALSGSNS